jgi:hypothetical protein
MLTGVRLGNVLEVVGALELKVDQILTSVGAWEVGVSACRMRSAKVPYLLD